jgi:hypothetical protein
MSTKILFVIFRRYIVGEKPVFQIISFNFVAPNTIFFYSGLVEFDTM